jgi:predicted dehydrogenase/threonine dehydrogenase-like Zn-dependent dehydrogenase
MKTLLQNDGSGKLTVTEVPPPLLRSGGVLVHTAASLLSAGTERSTRRLARKSLVGKALARPEEVRKVLTLMRREGVRAAHHRVAARLNVDRALGYSSAGLVVEVGAEAAGQFLVGQRVACAGAGYATHSELVYVPRNLCVSVPEGVDLVAGAFTTVGAIALHGVHQADVHVGERVAVIGLGLVGQLVAQILRAAGCRVVGVDLSRVRCSLALDLGADRTVVSGPDTAREVYEFSPGGVDGVLLTAASTSNRPLELAASICRDRARITVVGDTRMTLPRDVFYRRELDLRLSRSYGPGRYDTVYEEHGVDYPIGYVRWTENRNMSAFLELVAHGAVQVEPLITHRFTLAQADAAYATLEGRAGGPALGVVFTFPPLAPGLERGDARVDIDITSRAAPKPADGVPGVGLIGAGAFATGVLLPALAKHVRRSLKLRGIASATGISASTIGRRFGFAFCTSDARQVLEDADTRAVMIATRHDEHARLVVAALQAGKVVFVEKPLALTRDQLQEVMAAQRAGGCAVVVGFNRRFSTLVREVRAHFATRQYPLVVVMRVNAGFLPGEHWTQDPIQGGGRILGEACHFVDLMADVVGRPFAEVSAQALPDCGRYSGDNVCATFRFADGSLGSLVYVANGHSAVPKERIEVSGGGKSAIIDDFREVRLYADGKVRRIRARGQDKGHQAELDSFVELLRGAPAVQANFEASVASTLATLALQESMISERTVPIDVGACT